MMERLYPLRLSSVTKSPIWGGKKLLQNWNKTSASDTVGESWELTVREKENSIVCNGVFQGKTLHELISLYQGELTGVKEDMDSFPLLVKLIDAADDLSVQVHPDDEYAARVENDRGKTEFWYIVDAEEGAELVFGLREGVSGEQFATAARRGEVQGLLKRQPVRAGESYMIPSGLPHAIGKGILIAEIQQNSDLTYRVYDYERRQPDGTLRELHVEKAIDVIRSFSAEEIDAIRFSRSGGRPLRQEVLADCKYFQIEKKVFCAGCEQTFSDGVMQHLLCLSGEILLECDGEVYPIRKGESWLLPAALSGVTANGQGELLVSRAYVN